MIRLNDRDSALATPIAQYQELLTERKHALVNRLSEQAKPIGMILIGEHPENPLRRASRSLTNTAIGP